MATILAINNGNWNEPSIWDSGTVPTIDDVVYLNGHTVTANVNIDLGTNGEIRNDEEPGVGAVAGGTLSWTGGKTLTTNFYCFNSLIINQSGQSTNLTFNGNIYVENSLSFYTTGNAVGWIVNGDITVVNGSFSNVTSRAGTIRITGNVSLTNSTLFSSTVQYSTNAYSFTINGDVTLDSSSSLLRSSLNTNAILTINGNYTGGKICNNVTSVYLVGSVTGLLDDMFVNVGLLDLIGTLTQGQGQIASYITTLNLDGTLNLSGTRPFTTGVQNLNVATGGSVTYDNHLYYCFTNIVAVDSNFTITCRNQNLDNFDFKNKNLLNNTYPAQANVSDGYVYGLEDQFTGSYQLPPESVVLEGTPYGSHVGTLTLDI